MNMSPKKKYGNPDRNEDERPQDDTPASGTIPDPEALDFEEYEDEDSGSINQNGEQNEEPDVSGGRGKSGEEEGSNY